MPSKVRDNESRVPPRFEKLAEWYFVREYLNPSAFSSPLAGERELAGDAILGNGDARFCLVEFKKDETVRPTERAKYPAMRQELNAHAPSEKACHQLVGEASAGTAHPHALVLGSYAFPEDTLVLDGLDAEEYWGDWVALARPNDVHGPSRSEPALARKPLFPDDLPGQIGISTEEFALYVNRVVEAKGGHAEAGSGGWMYDLVLGLVRDANGERTVVMTLWDFARATADSRLEMAFANAHARLANDVRRQAMERPRLTQESTQATVPPAPRPVPDHTPRRPRR